MITSVHGSTSKSWSSARILRKGGETVRERCWGTGRRLGARGTADRCPSPGSPRTRYGEQG
eukprot:2963843-Alexandrium_andersonii.AAC.1